MEDKGRRVEGGGWTFSNFETGGSWKKSPHAITCSRCIIYFLRGGCPHEEPDGLIVGCPKAGFLTVCKMACQEARGGRILLVKL